MTWHGHVSLDLRSRFEHSLEHGIITKRVWDSNFKLHSFSSNLLKIHPNLPNLLWRHNLFPENEIGVDLMSNLIKISTNMDKTSLEWSWNIGVKMNYQTPPHLSVWLSSSKWQFQYISFPHLNLSSSLTLAIIGSSF